MNLKISFVCILTIGVLSGCCYAEEQTKSASDVVVDIYKSCLSSFSTKCVKPKALNWISEISQQDRIQITNDLSIIRTRPDDVTENQQQSRENRFEILNQIEQFLATHSLRIETPEILKTAAIREVIPKSYLNDGLANGLEVPLSEGAVTEGRGFVKKVMIPFLLGLKLKTTVLLPLALALIALKTWKAMTLGLLSIVLSGALVIFKIAKPKVVNYEVVHYPHPHHHHIEHHIEHPHHIEHAHIEHPHHHHHATWEQPAWARSFDAQNLAYSQQI